VDNRRGNAVPLPFGLRALRHRDYRLVWGGLLVSLIGTWMQSVAQTWLVLDLTGSALRLGLINTIQYAPILLLALPGGALSDRVRKRRLILLTQSALMAQALLLAVLSWTGHVRYWHVAVLALLYGVAVALDMPARQSFVSDLVGRGDVMSAIALNSTVFNAARVTGPALGGLVVARYGTTPAFSANALSFLAVIGALLAVRTEGSPGERAAATVRQELAEAVRYATGTPLIAFVLGLLLAVCVFVINFTTLTALIARDVLHLDADGFGLLMACHGSGAVLGARALALLGLTRPPRRLLIGAALAVSAALLGLAFARAVWVAGGLLLAAGCAQILFVASCNTALQVTAPERLRGRVMGLYALTVAGTVPFGALFVGTVAEQWGPAAACAVGGGLGLALVTALTALWLRTSRGGRPAAP
jgi:predicted MFS family arabinose efflux permease